MSFKNERNVGSSLHNSVQTNTGESDKILNSVKSSGNVTHKAAMEDEERQSPQQSHT